MKKISLILSVIAIMTVAASAAFADDTARDAMIAYSGTDTFTRLSPEERRACMYWISEGGQMSETCRSAATRLIAEEPDAVTPQQRQALLAAASGKVSTSSTPTRSRTRTEPPVRESKTVKNDDNTGAIVAAGIIGVVAGMIIHNNLPSHKSTSYRPAPPPPRMPPHRPAPAPAPHRGMPPRR